MLSRVIRAHIQRHSNCIKINKYGGKLLFESSLSKDVISTMFTKNIFLQELLLAWANVNNNLTIEHVGKEIIWNNKYIQLMNTSIIYKTWLGRNIFMITA